MLCSVMASMSLLMALSIVVTVWGDSSWQPDFGQTGRVGEETWDTLQLMAGLLMDILMLDIVWVIVVSAVEVVAVVLMFQRVSVSQMTVSSRDEIVKLVGHVRWVVNQVLQFEGSQDERG
jgi:hypothetical protein